MNIYEKIIKLKEIVGGFDRDSSAPGMKYKYVGGTQVYERVNPALANLKLLFIMKGATKDDWQKHEYDTRNGHKIDFIVSGKLFYQFVNAENPDEKIDIDFVYYGQQDEISKAFGSGLTYSERYLILKFLGLPTDSDDPDAKPQFDIQPRGSASNADQQSNQAKPTPKQENAPTPAPRASTPMPTTKSADDVANEIKAQNSTIMKMRITPIIESAVAKSLAENRIDEQTATTLKSTLAKLFFTKHHKFPLNSDGKLSGFELSYDQRAALDTKNVVIVCDDQFIATLRAFVEQEIASNEFPF